jgi:hypothetical protein
MTMVLNPDTKTALQSTLSHRFGLGSLPDVKGIQPTVTGEDGQDEAMKAAALLNQRRVIPLGQRELDQEVLFEWWRAAVTIQAAIYRIDRYYEVSALIVPTAEIPMWREVERHLCGNDGRGSAGVWSAFEDLKHYADTERRLHAFDPIDVREFETILILKCSDVRLARALFWAYYGRPLGPYETAFWSAHDECWELIEDLVDLKEDGADWNFNFWLYPFMAGHSGIAGVQAVSALLERKLSQLQDIFRCVPTTSRVMCQEPLARTLRAARRAESLRGTVFTTISTGRVVRFDDRANGRESQLSAEARCTSLGLETC